MSEDKNLSSQNDPIGLDPQLMGSSQNQAVPDPTPLTPTPDPIGLDPNLSILLKKSQNPELVALDPQLTSQTIESLLGRTGEKSVNETGSSHSPSEEQSG